MVDLVSDPKRPGACLFVCGTHTIGACNNDVSRELAARRIAGEADMRRRFEAAKKHGDLPAESDPKTIAKLAATLIWGISVQASNGATKTELSKLAALAIESMRGQLQK